MDIGGSSIVSRILILCMLLICFPSFISIQSTKAAKGTVIIFIINECYNCQTPLKRPCRLLL